MAEKLDAAEQVSKIGISLTLIFIGIGLGMTIWLGYFISHHNWTRQISQEQRGVQWVGEKEAPKAPLKITVKNSGCLRVDKAIVDAEEFKVIVSRVCGREGDYAEFHWREVANNTVIDSGYTNWQVDEVGLGESIEYNPGEDEFHIDPRATEMILSTRDN